MSKAEASPEANPEISPESSPKNFKKIAYILGAAIFGGLLMGCGAVLALRNLATPSPAPAAQTPLRTTAPHDDAADVKATSAVDAPTSASDVPTAAPATALVPAATRPASLPPIPVLTGTEMKERYHITRFIDKEADMLCYVAESLASGMTGSVACVPRPSGLAKNPGN